MVELQSKIDKKIVAELPKVSFPGRIFVIYTEAEARKAIDYLNTHVLVGVDTETRPSFRKGAVNKVALLQVSTYDTLSLKDDFAMLRRRNQKDPRMGNWVELQDYVASFGIEEKSLQKIYALLFQEKISKSQRLSNWEADTLTEAQQLYAATDAWACVRIYQYLEELRLSGKYRVIRTETPENILED